MRRVVSIPALLLGCSLIISAADTVPKLVVVIVVDQMRADYIDRFRNEWTSGLRRLVDHGAWFTEAAYPYLTTVTCSGHATIATGAYPHRHGVLANSWFDRQRKLVSPCTDDGASKPVYYGSPPKSVGEPTGPGNLKIPTLAETMRGNGAHVVTLSLKARSAIMLAGHSGDAVTWIADSMDGWETSAPFATHPVLAVQEYLDAHPMSADFGKSWTRLLSPDHYKDPDDGLAELPIRGWTATFPHALKGEPNSSVPDSAYYDQWQHSPYADDYLATMAAALVRSMQLGSHGQPDFLGVSFSSPDLVGHSYGPRSQEIQDIYAHLDRSIGALLDSIDRTVGRDKYVVALSADHGVTPIPEQTRAAGLDGGRIDSTEIVRAAQAAAQATLGRGNYVSRLLGNGIYFEPGMYARTAAKPDLLREVTSVIAREPGISRVFTSEELKNGAASSDRELRAAALSYVPGRSGDLVISPKPGWMISGGGTTHGSANRDDQHVPIVLFGDGIRPGRYTRAVSPADIAPTLASMVGVTLDQAEGHSLSEALR
jgi:predicted AlkP superfamily pyrophosphatase or phosphodiesterase